MLFDATPQGLKPAQKQVKFDIVKIRRKVCREDYYSFCQEFWDEIIAEVPVWNWHIRIMANELQKLAERMFLWKPKEYDLIFNVPPGSSKSTIGSIMLCPWLWTRLPSARFIGCSWDEGLAWDLGNKARRLVKSQKYKETFPSIEISADQDTKIYFSNTLKGERRSTSTGSNITGRHAHMIGIDDPLNPLGARSAAKMEEVDLYMKETLPSRCVSLDIVPFFLIMQRLGIDDPTGVWLNRKGGTPVRHICLPAEESDMVQPKIFRNKYKNGLLDPVRLPKRILETKRMELGQYGYAGQYEQDPDPLHGGMFEVDKFVILDHCPKIEEFFEIWRWYDKAATAGGGAYTAGVAMGRRKQTPQFVVLNVVREQVNTAQREILIRKTCEVDSIRYGKKYKIGIEQEPGSAGVDSSLATIQNLAGFNVIAEKPTGDKEIRADAYSTQVNAGNVGLVKAKWNDEYMGELQRFSNEAKYKDQVDASSGAFNKLLKKKVKVGAGHF